MKNNYYYSILLLLFISASVCGQENKKLKDNAPIQKTLKLAFCGQENKKLKDNAPIQKTLKLASKLPMTSAISAFTKEYNLGKGNTFEAKKASNDKTGLSHQRHQQFYNGIKVEFGMLITHSSSEGVNSINGELYNAEGLNLSPSLSKTDGLNKAIASTKATKFLWEDAVESSNTDYKKPEGELVIFPRVKTGEVKLAYKYDIYATQPISRNEIFVDAHTGQILFKNPIIKHATGLISKKETKDFSEKIEMLITANAATKYSGNRTIETSFNTPAAKFVLNDLTRGGGIVTYNSAKTNTRPATNFTDVDNDWTAAEFNNANYDNAALDAHWGAEMTFDFWKNIFQRNSYDDNNARIRSYVHFDDVPGGAGYFNATWNGSSMTYGDGSTKPLTSIDICGHEIGHAVCTFTANLAYQNQSGGMNEGYSDIWGACIEHYGRTGSLNGPYAPSVWLIAEDINGGFRSMSNPRSKGDPDTYLGAGWIATGDEGSCIPRPANPPSDPGNDNCGVHTNSGVLNHWFYILTVGKSGTNSAPVPDTYNVTGIGMTLSSEIAYLAERDYLTANSTFADARAATLTVAGNMYCSSSPEYIAVNDAWHAVNVGEKFIVSSDDVNLKSVSSSVTVACNTSFSPSIVFENAGTNPITSIDISYNIDGGTNMVETWTGNLNVCSSQTYSLTLGGLTRGTHLLTVTTTVVNDGQTSNNTKTSNIVVNDSGVANIINTFDTQADALIAIDELGTNTVWERGISTKTQLSDAVAGNSPVYVTKLSGLYPDKIKSFLVSQCYDLTTLTNPVVKFNMAYDFETDWDLLYMEYSIDGGTLWNPLGTGASPTWYTSERLPNGADCFNCIGGQWTGEGDIANPRGDGINAKMREYSYDLVDFGSGGVTPQSNMIFRFVFLSDDMVAEEGAMIDNFVIQGTFLSTPENAFNSFSVSPNPSKGTVILSLSTITDVNVSLFDISGRNIYKQNYSNSDISFNQELKFNNLSKGIYILSVESDGKRASKKLIIE